jgi:hypothetical protein
LLYTNADEAFIFVLTETETVLAELRGCLKERLIYTDCQRTSGDTPIFDNVY